MSESTVTKDEKSSAKSNVSKEALKKEPKKKNAAVNVAIPENSVSPFVNTALWIVSIAVICCAIFGNYYYSNYVVIDESSLARLARIMIVIASIAAGLGVLLFTNKGHALLNFSRLSYTELRKVVWPTRQEALQTTFIVFVAVSVVSLFLYLCDIVFLQLVRAITL